MDDYLKQILAAQYEAALFMLNECIEKCPADQWEATIGKYPFWQTAYHTLMFADCYLSPTKEQFDCNHEHLPRGMQELEDEYGTRRTKEQLLKYLEFCRDKAQKNIPRETEQSLRGPSGFDWYKVTRGEMHIINLRHIAHHTGQLSSQLRRTNPELQDPKAVRWAGSGWRKP